MPQQPLARVPDDSTWDWQARGLCLTADNGDFFHPQNERGLARIRRDRRAKAICADCAVRIECADYAIRAHEPYGIWGGLTEEEREQIYSRIPLENFPTAVGEAARAAADAIAAAVSDDALGIVHRRHPKPQHT